MVVREDPKQVLRQKGGRRTYSELQKVLQQWQAAQSGTKPVKTIKTGFLSGGRAKGKLSDTQLHRRQELKAKIKTIRQSMRQSGSKLPETDVARRVRKQNPETPTIPRPSNGNNNQTPPTKPTPQPGRVGAANGALSARRAALRNLSKR